jgi:hypothetical protein
MKSIISAIIVTIICSCSQIKNNVENNFVEINSSLLDSIEMTSNKNFEIIKQLRTEVELDLHSKNIIRAYQSIMNHNNFIDSTINLIVKNSESISSKVAPQKYLLDLKMADQIK